MYVFTTKFHKKVGTFDEFILKHYVLGCLCRLKLIDVYSERFTSKAKCIHLAKTISVAAARCHNIRSVLAQQIMLQMEVHERSHLSSLLKKKYNIVSHCYCYFKYHFPLL
jgi:hypothetical protein